MAKVLCRSEQNALTRRVLILPAVGPDCEEAVLEKRDAWMVGIGPFRLGPGEENTVNAGSRRIGKPNRLAIHPFCTVCDGAKQALARAGGPDRRHGECPFRVPTHHSSAIRV